MGEVTEDDEAVGFGDGRSAVAISRTQICFYQRLQARLIATNCRTTSTDDYEVDIDNAASHFVSYEPSKGMNTDCSFRCMCSLNGSETSNLGHGVWHNA